MSLCITLNDAPTLFTLYRKTISCVAFSSGGKYLAAGECGHQPCVRVWDVASQSILSELQGHTFGVACVVRQQRGMCVWVGVHRCVGVLQLSLVRLQLLLTLVGIFSQHEATCLRWLPT